MVDSPSPRRSWIWTLLEQPRPRVAVVGGILAAVVVAAAVSPFEEHVTRALPVLLLIIPVIAAAVIGGRASGFVVAAAATLAFGFALPPRGSPRVRLSEDVLALVVFSATSLFVSALVTTKVSALRYFDEQRRALLRSVSHDLRTPLSAIRAVATDLRSGAAYDERMRDELLDVLIDEAERLDRFVANLLSMSRIEAGAMRPRLTAVDVAELVEVCARRFDRMFRGWDVEIDVPEDLPMVRADPAQLEQVINNLFENVTRHTPSGTRVRVAARALDGQLEITVEDDGPGVPPEQIALLGMPPSDGDRSLGLAICRSIVELHTGTFHVDNHRPSGLCIAIDLPYAY
jgi:two-component system sensor histidine kinase KdpD